MRGDSSVTDLLTLSQVVLALQLPFAMFPLLHFTSSRKRMGSWKNGWFLLIAGWASAILITAMDIYGLPDSLEVRLAGHRRRLTKSREERAMYKTILVTLDGTPTDRAIIEHVKQLAKLAHSRVVLLHVADGWAARTYGPDAVSPEITRGHRLSGARSAPNFRPRALPTEAELAYGDPVKEIVKWVKQQGLRPGGHEHPRPPLRGRPFPRHHRQPRPAQRPRAGAAPQGKMTAYW